MTELTITNDVIEVAEFRSRLAAWLEDNDLAPPPGDSQDALLQQHARVLGALYDADWMRWGWPADAGGLGGPAILRAVLGEEIVGRRLDDPDVYSSLDVVAGAVLEYARPVLAAEMVPRLLSGTEFWCHEVSEPGSDGDLTSLRSLASRAEQRGDGWVITGQRVRMSFAQYADRCILLTRTGPGHAGITAFLVDMDSPGIDVRSMHGAEALCEVDFDGVVVPVDRMLGKLGDGWQLAIDLLLFERPTSLWQHVAYLYSRFDALVDDVKNLGQSSDPDMGQTYLALHTLRCRSLVTQRRTADQRRPHSDHSIDLLLLSSAEDQLHDAARDLLPGAVALDDTTWHTEYLRSGVSSPLVGATEAQLDRIARRLLDHQGKSA